MCNIYTLIIPILSELVFYTANVNTEIKSFLQRPYFFQHLRFLNQKKKNIWKRKMNPKTPVNEKYICISGKQERAKLL